MEKILQKELKIWFQIVAQQVYFQSQMCVLTAKSIAKEWKNKMGLDMYLYAKLRMGKYCAEHLKETEELIRKGVPNMFKSGNLDTVEIKFEVGYWRKANQIHKWFVDNVQDGEDECIPHCVSRESLKKLREVCKQVTKLIESKKSKKEEELKDLLPTEEGFFFGSTDYDEWYMEDIKATIKIINKCLKLPKDWEFEYRSSW